MLSFADAVAILRQYLETNPPAMSGHVYVSNDGYEDDEHFLPTWGPREQLVENRAGFGRMDSRVLLIDKRTGNVLEDVMPAAFNKVNAMREIKDGQPVTPGPPPKAQPSLSATLRDQPPPVPPPPAPAPIDPMAERARKLVEELRRVPSWWGVSFRGFTREAQFGVGTRSAVARGLVPASRNLRMATENYTCAGAYAIVGPDGRAIESIAIEQEQEIVFLPGTFFQFIGDYEVDGFPIRLVNQTTIDPADRAEVDWDNIRNRVAALHEHETKKAKGNYRIYTPGKFVGDID